MKNYLQDKFDQLVDEYLTDNCSQVEEKAPWGDTEATVSFGYKESDRIEAECYAMDRLEEELFSSLKELKQERGFEPKDVKQVIEKAQEVVNGL